MFGLNATLSQASQALSAESGALSVTNNNIANVNTTGYSREVAHFSAEALSGSNGSQQNGVAFEGFTSIRDNVLQLAINQKTAEAGTLSAQSALWSQVEAGFSSTTSGVGSSITSLFSALSTLSTSPSDSATRQSAFAAAGNLVDAFHQAASTLADAQTQADDSITGIVANINDLTTQIASLNGQLATMQAAGQDGGSLQDQRDALTTQLAALTGVVSTATDSTPSLSTASGSPLVVANTAYALMTTRGSDGTTHVIDAEGQDITSTLQGGSLGGALTMRDSGIPQVREALDQLATQFATAMNAAQAQGYDGSGAAGEAMFQLPAAGESASAGISLTLTSGSGLALSSDGSTGSSGNLSKILAVQTNALPSGQNPTDSYASLVQAIGQASSNTSSSLSATNGALSQLQTQQSTESGVSIDEETTNLLRYQQAYSAAAKVVSTVNDMYSILMNMGIVTS